MATLIIDHSQNCPENSPRGGLRKKLNMAFLSCFLLFFYFIGFPSTIACVPPVTWHLTTPELFQKTSGASVTNLEVNNCRDDHVSDTCDEMPFMFTVYHYFLYGLAHLTHLKSAPSSPTSSQSQPCFLSHFTTLAVLSSSSLGRVPCCYSIW